MIPIPPTWLARRDGAALVLVPDGGGGLIRYLERVRPRASVSSIIERLLSDVEVVEIAPPRRFETDEGEYAAQVSATIRSSAGIVREEIGLVLVGDFYAVVDATVTDERKVASFRAEVERLTRADVHALGERRRWFRHEGPDGWRAERRNAETVWRPGDGRPVAITVWHAVPRSTGASSELMAEAIFSQDAAAGYVLLGGSPGDDVTTDHGLSGASLRVRGHFPRLPVTERLLIALEDTSFVYGLKLESPGELASGDVEVFERLVASARPLPARRAGAPEAFSHWGD